MIVATHVKVKSPISVSRPNDLSYLGNCPPGFADLADVLLQVDDKQLPAHSQFLASQSRLFEGLLRDTGGTFCKREPLVISTPLQSYRKIDVLTFLRHVYKDQQLQSEQEAWELLPIADQFDSPSLTEKAVTVIEAAQGTSLFSNANNNKDVLDWWHLAERFNLHSFKSRCVRAVAQRFEVMQHDKRMLELQPQAAVDLMQAIQQILQERTKVYYAQGYTCSSDKDTTIIKHYFCTANSCPGHSVSVRFGPRYMGGDGGTVPKGVSGEECCLGAQIPEFGVDASHHQSRQVDMKAHMSRISNRAI